MQKNKRTIDEVEITQSEKYRFDPFQCYFKYIYLHSNQQRQMYLYLTADETPNRANELIIERVYRSVVQTFPSDWHQQIGTCAVFALTKITGEADIVDFVRKQFITEKLSV